MVSACCAAACLSALAPGGTNEPGLGPKPEGTSTSQIIHFTAPSPEPAGGGMGDVINHLPPGVASIETPATQQPKSPAPPLTPEDALFLAVGQTDAQEARRILDAGVKVNHRQPATGMTPLMACVTREGAAALLKSGADPMARDNHGATALHHAVFSPEATGIVPLLIKHGADVNAVATGQCNETPLLAARVLFIEHTDSKPAEAIVRALVAAGANINAADAAGYTALATAVVNRRPRMAKFFLSLGADPNQPDKEGLTPIARARALGFPELIDLLAAKGARQ